MAREPHGAAVSGASRVGRTVGAFELSECRYAPAHTIPRHHHPKAQLCFVLHGGYLERYRAMDLACEAGTVLLHVPGEVHSDHFGDRGGRCLHVILPESLPRELDPVLIGPSRRVVPEWRLLWAAMRLHASDELSALELEETVLDLLAALKGAAGLEVSGRAPSWLERVRAEVHQLYRGSPRLAGLAAGAGVHRVSLARAFRRHYGCTIGQYVRQRRVEVASRLLAASETRLTDVAYDAGFADQAHLTRTFKALVGLTPAEYRRRMRSAAGGLPSRVNPVQASSNHSV